jgi:hypothetical protein
VHEVPVWNNNLYLMAQMLFKPVGSVTPPPSIGSYNGEPISGGFGGMGAGPGRGAGAGGGMMGGGRGMGPGAGAGAGPGAGMGAGPGMGPGMMGGGGANSEFTAKRDKTGSSSTGAAGKWIIKDGDSELKLELKVEGSKLSGTFDNPQMGGAVQFKDGKIEGNNISFDYLRSVNGQDIKIIWTGTLSGDEMKLKREVGGGMPGGR